MFRQIALAFAAALFLISTPVVAQVRQSGSVTNGHAASWTTSGIIQDGGTASNGAINALGITASGTPFCINDAAATSGNYHQLCLGANSLGGGLLSFNSIGSAPVVPFQVDINGVTTTIGQGTVNVGVAGQIPYYPASTSVLSGNSNLNISNGALSIGQVGAIGTLSLLGNTGGTVTIKPQATAGTFNFNLPITAGTSGQALVSGGGGSAPMTWQTFGGTVNVGTSGQGAYYSGNGTILSGSSSLILSATSIGINPSVAGTMDNVAVGGATPLAGAFTTVLGTGQISSGVAGSSLGSFAVSGSTSGTIIIKPQTTTSSYNLNLPTTAGTSGTPLLSGGGGAGAMTYGTLSGNTSSFATTTGSLTNGHSATFDASGNIVDGGPLPTGSINSGTAGQLTYYAGSGTTVSGNANVTYTSGLLAVGTAGGQAGSLSVAGSSTGVVTIKGSGTAIGTFNFNLPITAGTSNGPLLSGGGGSSAMSWGTASGNTTKFGTVTGSLTNGNCLAADASGNLIDNGSPCGTGGSGTVTSSTAGQIAYYPASTAAVAGNSGLTISGTTVTIGVASTSLGTLALTGNTGGTVSIKPQATAGTFNFNLPTTAGSAGQFLTSQGGGSTAMTWSSAGLAAITAQTTNFNASSNTAYCADTSGGAVTATLPASPANNDVILFVSCSNYSTNNLILARNGNNIQGLAANMTVATDNASFHLIFVTSYGWRMY